MPRSVRHTTVRMGGPMTVDNPLTSYRQVTKEKVVYANDMTVGSNASLTNIGVSPCWQLDNGADQHVYADLKIPLDRVPDTPLVFKLFYCTAGGGGNILFYIKVLVAGLGVDLTTAPSPMFSVAPGTPPNILDMAPQITLQATEIDHRGPIQELQLNIGREGAHALDTSDQNAYIFKLVVEYTGYE